MHKMAIDSMALCTKKWHVQFYITFNKVAKTAVIGNLKWRIKVMNQVFIDKDFVVCARQAVELVMNAFGSKDMF